MMDVSLEGSTLASALIGLFSLIGAVFYGLKKNGLVTFGRPKERRHCAKTCAEHPSLVKEVGAIHKKIDSVGVDVARIVGYIQGKNGEKI